MRGVRLWAVLVFAALSALASACAGQPKMEANCGAEGQRFICRFTNVGPTKASACARLNIVNKQNGKRFQFEAVCSGAVEPGASSTIPLTSVPSEDAAKEICLDEAGKSHCEPEVEFTRQPTAEGSSLDFSSVSDEAAGAFASYAMLLLVALTSAWVLMDARRNRIPGNSPGVWFVGCLLLWILAFPWYLIKRASVLRARRADAARDAAMHAAQGTTPPPPA